MFKKMLICVSLVGMVFGTSSCLTTSGSGYPIISDYQVYDTNPYHRGYLHRVGEGRYHHNYHAVHRPGFHNVRHGHNVHRPAVHRGTGRSSTQKSKSSRGKKH